MAKIDSISSAANAESVAKLEEWSTINPLINSDGTTESVSSVLRSLATLLTASEEQDALSIDASLFGVSLILDTCRAALDHMR